MESIFGDSSSTASLAMRGAEMTSIFRTAILFGLFCPGCFAQTPMDVQPVKKLVPTGYSSRPRKPGGSLKST